MSVPRLILHNLADKCISIIKGKFLSSKDARFFNESLNLKIFFITYWKQIDLEKEHLISNEYKIKET